jgi:hypothetical protein
MLQIGSLVLPLKACVCLTDDDEIAGRRGSAPLVRQQVVLKGSRPTILQGTYEKASPLSGEDHGTAKCERSGG